MRSDGKKKKDLAPFEAKSLIFMVGVAGFELATPCTPCKFLMVLGNPTKSRPTTTKP